MRNAEQTKAAFHFLKVSAVAERLDISTGQVLRLIAAKELEAVDISAGAGRRPTYRVAPESVDALIQRRGKRHAA